MVDLLAERSEMPRAERDQLTVFHADRKRTVREDRRLDHPMGQLT